MSAVLGPQIFAGWRYWRIQPFLWQYVTVVYPLSGGKSWLSSVVWSARAKPANEEKRSTFRGWVKTPVLFLFLAVSLPKFVKFWGDVGDLSSFPTPFPDCLCHVPRRRYWPLTLPLSCKVVENSSFWPHFLWGGGDTQKHCPLIHVMC